MLGLLSKKDWTEWWFVIADPAGSKKAPSNDTYIKLWILASKPNSLHCPISSMLGSKYEKKREFWKCSKIKHHTWQRSMRFLFRPKNSVSANTSCYLKFTLVATFLLCKIDLPYKRKGTICISKYWQGHIIIPKRYF